MPKATGKPVQVEYVISVERFLLILYNGIRSEQQLDNWIQLISIHIPIYSSYEAVT